MCFCYDLLKLLFIIFHFKVQYPSFIFVSGLNDDHKPKRYISSYAYPILIPKADRHKKGKKTTGQHH